MLILWYNICVKIMPREPVVVTLGIFYISNLLYRRHRNSEFSYQSLFVGLL